VAEHSDAVLLAIRASAPHLVDLKLDPPLAATARLGLVRLARRTPPHALEALRRLIDERLVERAPRSSSRTSRRAARA
jgi:hypothetical protein